MEKGRWLMSSTGSFSSAIAYTNGILPGADYQQPSRRCMLWKVAGGVSFHDACNHDMPGRLLAVAFADVLAPGTTLEPSTASHLPAVLQQGFAQINEVCVCVGVLFPFTSHRVRYPRL